MSKTLLTVSMQKASQQISQRIKLGNEILNRPKPQTITRTFVNNIRDSIKKWNDYNSTFLKKLFSDESVAEKYDSIESAKSYNSMRDYYNKIIELCYLKISELESIKERLGLYKKSAVVTKTLNKTNEESTLSNTDHKNVFVVHGRNTKLRDSLFDFLRSIGLKPIEWNQAIAATNKGTPSVEEILDAAFSHAQAVVVLLSGDDEARLEKQFLVDNDEYYEKQLTPQARPNVLFEAGMAMGRNPDRTVLIQIGQLRPWSDIGGDILLILIAVLLNATSWKQN